MTTCVCFPTFLSDDNFTDYQSHCAVHVDGLKNIWSLFLPENSEKVKSVKEIMKSFCQMDNDVEQFLEVANATMTQVS